MPTTVHIPPALLAAVDRKAKKLKISRNKLIVKALESEVSGDDKGWPPGFFEQFTPPETDEDRAIDEEFQRLVTRPRRSRKPPPEL